MVRQKSAKQKYYNLSEIQKTNSQYNFILGERSNGKSFAIKKHCLERAIKNNDYEKFFLLRRYSDDIKKEYVISYFGDKNLNIEKLTNGRFNSIITKSGKIQLVLIDENNKISSDFLTVGYVRSINQAERYKSNTYEDVSNVIFEEFVATGLYLTNEIDKFLSIISTIARRDEIRVYLIGNTISRNCIYFQYFNLKNVPKQKQGTIDIYTFKSCDQRNENNELIEYRIAVELCANLSQNTKMYFGESSQKAITSGAWCSDDYPRIKVDEECKLIHTIIFEYGFSMFKADCYIKNDFIFWKISPKNTEIKRNTRLITDKFSKQGRLISYKLESLTIKENKLLSLFNSKKVFYSDNLTGTEFNQALNYFKRL